MEVAMIDSYVCFKLEKLTPENEKFLENNNFHLPIILFPKKVDGNKRFLCK
jgi:hypothetical protein